MLSVPDAPDGVTLTPYDRALDMHLEIGREFMREYRDALPINSPSELALVDGARSC